jgi:molybdenum cofactor guanylyltransferase
MTVEPFTGAVLLGGASRRYGSDKALALHGGVMMGQRMIDVVHAAGAAEVVTVGGIDRGFETPHWPDLYPGEGPLGGLLTLFSHPTSEIVAVVACDMPDLTAATIERLVHTVQHPEIAAAVAVTDRREPLCAAYRVQICRSAAEELFRTGVRSLHELLATLNVFEVVLSDFAEVRNVNSPQDHVT